MIVAINSLLAIWLAGAGVTFAIVLLGSHAFTADDGHTVDGVERFFVDLVVIFCWPRYMLPAVIRAIRK